MGGARNPSTTSSASTEPVLVTSTAYETAAPAASTSAIEGKAGLLLAFPRLSSEAQRARESVGGAERSAYVKVVYDSPKPKGTTGLPV